MFEAAAILYLSVETPLHAGTGSSLGVVDLPIQRERTTHYPMIQGSGIKGPLRSLAKTNKLQDWELIFGPETREASAFAGALSVGDARILLFPVRSLTDVFVYTTSADVIARFRRDVARGGPDSTWPEMEQVSKSRALLTEKGLSAHTDVLVLEESSFTSTQSDTVQVIAASLASQIFSAQGDEFWRKKLERSLVVLPDDDFRDYTLYSTDVMTRVRLTEHKTVEKGALWTEEHLPAETVLYAPLYATAARKEGAALTGQQVLERVQSLVGSSNAYLQLGGEETIGRGIVRPSWQWLTPEASGSASVR